MIKINKKITRYQVLNGHYVGAKDYYIIGETELNYLCVYDNSDTLVKISKRVVHKGSPKDFNYQGQPFVYVLDERNSKTELEGKIDKVIALIEYYRLKMRAHADTIKDFENRISKEKSELQEMNKHIQGAIKSLTDSLKILKDRGD